MPKPTGSARRTEVLGTVISSRHDKRAGNWHVVIGCEAEGSRDIDRIVATATYPLKKPDQVLLVREIQNGVTHYRTRSRGLTLGR